MFSKPLNLKLTVLFSSIFALFSVLLFLFAYLLLHTSTRSEQINDLRAKMLELWAAYQTDTLDVLQRELILERGLNEEKQFMIRVADGWNNTLYFYLPEFWQGFDRELLERSDAFEEGGLSHLRARRGPESLEILSLRLPDQTLLQVGLNNRQRDRTLGRFRTAFLLVGFPLLLIGFAGAALLSSRLLRPLKQLIAAAREVIDTGRMESRLPARGSGDELDNLVLLFNRMLQKIDALIGAMRESLDNVAHDLKTPLTRLRSTAEAALRRPGERGEHAQALAACIEEADRILSLLNGLMDIAEAENGVMRLERRREELPPLIRDIADLYRYAAEEKGIRLREELPEALPAAVDPSRFRQVVANLLDNAVKYTPAGGEVTVRARQADGQAVIEVEDTGIGIYPAELPRIWERLYRGDRSRSQPGLGLGLSLVRAVVRAHGGTVEARSRPEQGALFTVRLPAAPPPPAPGAGRGQPAAEGPPPDVTGGPAPAAPAPGSG